MEDSLRMLLYRRGNVWTYAFVQEGGEGGTGWKKPLGLTPDAQGKLRGTFTFTAGNADKAGWAIDVRVNNRTMGQVWWRVNESGFAVTQSLGEYKELTVFEPPAVLLPWPLKAPQTWSYGPPEKRLKSTYRMWGPVPVTGPKGEAPGYVVLTEERGELHQDHRAALPARHWPGPRGDHHRDQRARDAEQHDVGAREVR